MNIQKFLIIQRIAGTDRVFRHLLEKSEIPNVCHSERSEESPECRAYLNADRLSGWKFVSRKAGKGSSRIQSRGILRSAQNDRAFKVLDLFRDT